MFKQELTNEMDLCFSIVDELKDGVNICNPNSVQKDQRVLVAVLFQDLLEKIARSRENQLVCWYLTVLTGQGDIKEVAGLPQLKGKTENYDGTAA